MELEDEGAMMVDRRGVLAVLAGALATPAGAPLAGAEPPVGTQSPGMSRVTAYAFSFARLNGGEIRLGDYAGKPILIVNTASLCGFTPQYAGLQELWARFHERGLLILGVPSNDFGGQEPGDADDIVKTAHDRYGVTFPLAAKVEVAGANPHP